MNYNDMDKRENHLMSKFSLSTKLDYSMVNNIEIENTMNEYQESFLDTIENLKGVDNDIQETNEKIELAQEILDKTLSKKRLNRKDIEEASKLLYKVTRDLYYYDSLTDYVENYHD